MSGNEMTVSEGRAELGPVTARAEYASETIYLTKHGHRSAAVVPAHAAELLERLEEVLDAEAVENALAELESGEGGPVPYVRRTAR